MVDLGDGHAELSKMGALAETVGHSAFHVRQGVLCPAYLIAPARRRQTFGPATWVLTELFHAEGDALHGAHDKEVE